jgi:hypothetical protein
MPEQVTGAVVDLSHAVGQVQRTLQALVLAQQQAPAPPLYPPPPHPSPYT